MFVELHILQNFPPSNLNRDDVGQPKDGDFGGYRRARISSQCLKRSIRYAGKNLKDDTSQSHFERYTGVPLSLRTAKMKAELATRLTASPYNYPQPVSDHVANLFAEAYAGGMNQKRKDETAVLLYLSEQELDRVAERLAANWDEVSKLALTAPKAAEGESNDKGGKAKRGKADKAEKSIITELVAALIKETKERTGAPDIALFGRMLADKPDTNIDAACQVAHAISTHAVPKSEIDYYTAVDEVKQRNDEQGAGFLDVAYFNSACFYRYARIDVGQLTRNLGNNAVAQEVTHKAVEAFLRASEAAIPTGKKNSYAPECRPSFMLAVVRADQSEGWSLVNAFEKPVRPTETGLVEASVSELCAEFDDHCERYSGKSVIAKSVVVSRRVASSVTGRLAGAIAQAPADEVSALDVWVQTTLAALKGV